MTIDAVPVLKMNTFPSPISAEHKAAQIALQKPLTYINDEDAILRNNGYLKSTKLCDTLQGELFKASMIKQHRQVAIKKTTKYLFQKRIAIQDDIHFIVAENIVQEASILRYLTVDHHPIGDYVVKFVDFFESDTAYYLVIEYIDSEMNLKQFISKCAEYIANGELSVINYRKMVKFILWQLFVTVQWMHTINCCHLDLCLENIMIKNATFHKTASGISINPKLSIKLCDFGAAECFRNGLFSCMKYGLNIDNEGYVAPNMFAGDPYDARCADNWSLGMILFQCMTIGQQLYGPHDMYLRESGYNALLNGELREYLCGNQLISYFSVDCFVLLSGLLHYDERYRLNGMHVLTQKWFKMYFKTYSPQIVKKFFLRNTRRSSGDYCVE